MKWPLSKWIWCLTFKKYEEQSHLRAGKGNTGLWATFCFISDNSKVSLCFKLSYLLTFDTWRTKRISSTALLKGGEITVKKTDTSTLKSGLRSVWRRGLLKFFDRWIFHCLTWRLTQSHLDDIYQEDFLFSFSCSCCREIFSTATFSLQANHVWISESAHQCSFVARVCLAWWRWCGSSPQCTSLWESLD